MKQKSKIVRLSFFTILLFIWKIPFAQEVTSFFVNPKFKFKEDNLKVFVYSSNGDTIMPIGKNKNQFNFLKSDFNDSCSNYLILISNGKRKYVLYMNLMLGTLDSAEIEIKDVHNSTRHSGTFQFNFTTCYSNINGVSYFLQDQGFTR